MEPMARPGFKFSKKEKKKDTQESSDLSSDFEKSIDDLIDQVLWNGENSKEYKETEEEKDVQISEQIMKGSQTLNNSEASS